MRQVKSIGVTISNKVSSMVAPTTGHLVFQPYARQHGDEDELQGRDSLLLPNIASRNVNIATGGAMRYVREQVTHASQNSRPAIDTKLIG